MNLFDINTLLDSHSNDAEIIKSYRCQEKSTFSSTRGLSEKSATKRSRSQRHKCTFCEHRACTKSDLRKHERVHTGERPYMCHVCGEGYLQSSHLHDHSRVHSGLKPYTCDVCLRGFSKKSDMQRHRRIHTGELPYSCNFCGKSFRQTTQCSNHVKKHHTGTSKLANHRQHNTETQLEPDDVTKFNLDLFNIIARESPELLQVNDYETDLLFDTNYLDEPNILFNAFPMLTH